MANLKTKDINKLETWNEKELRKLRITIKNRINALKESSKPKELSDNHPLYQLELGGCAELLDKVVKAEKILSRS